MSTDKSYTKIPNEIIEAAIRSNLSTLEWTALMYVIRKTYGWGKESDTISVRKMAKDTGHDFRAMQRAVSKLEESKVLLIQKGNTKINVMRVRNPDKWQKMTVTRPSTVRQPYTVTRPSPYGQATVKDDGQATVKDDGQATTHKRKKENKRNYTKEREPSAHYFPEDEEQEVSDEQAREWGWID